MSRQITDTLRRPDGSAYANVTVRFVADQTSADDGSVVQHSDSTAATDASGALSVELQNGVYLVYVDGARPLYLGKATITDGGPATLAEVLGASESVTSAILAAVELSVADALATNVLDVDGTAHTLVPDNSRTMIRFDDAADCTLSLPETGSFSPGALFHGLNAGGGAVTLSPVGAATLVGVGPSIVQGGYNFSVMVDAVDADTGAITWRTF